MVASALTLVRICIEVPMPTSLVGWAFAVAEHWTQRSTMLRHSWMIPEDLKRRVAAATMCSTGRSDEEKVLATHLDR